jgi:hypothetical protein
MLIDFGGHLLQARRLDAGQQDPGALGHPLRGVSVSYQAL